MKTYLFCVVALFCLPLAAREFPYDKKWEEIEKKEAQGLLKELLPGVDEIYDAAEKDGNVVQRIRALLYKSKIAVITSDDDEIQFRIIRDFETEISEADVREKHILESMLAEALYGYYRNNRWKIDQRTRTEEASSEDFRFWTENIFNDKITDLYLRSLENEKKLKAASLAEWQGLLENNLWLRTPEEKMSKEDVRITKGRELRPTIYDILVHRATDFLQDRSAMFFRTFDTDAGAIAKKEKAAALVLALADAHKEQGNTNAFLYNKLKVLRMSKTEYTVSLYVSELEKLSSFSPQSWYTGQVLLEMARFYKEQADKTENSDFQTRKQWYEKVLRTTGRIKKEYDNTSAAGEALRLEEELRKTEFSIRIETYLPSGQNNPLSVTHKNLDKIYFRVLRYVPDIKDYFYDPLQEIQYPKDTVRQQLLDALFRKYPIEKEFAISLKTFDDYQSHMTTAALEALRGGAYLVIASADPDFDTKKQRTILQYQWVYISDYAIADNGEELLVTDRKSGHPQKGVTVEVYRRNDKKLELVTQVRTGVAGKAAVRYPAGKGYYNQYYYRVAGEDVFYSKYQYRYNRSTNPEETNYYTRLFTDRSIYRPGQTVYFKAIHYKEAPDGFREVVGGEELDIELRDPNDDTVGEMSLTTNDFGAVSGEFVLPSGGLTGIFTLDSDDGETYRFSVEAYKRPRFEVVFDTVKKTFRLGEEITATAKAQSYSGANADRARVTYRVYREAVYPYLPWWRREYIRSAPREEIAHGETVTDAEGNFKVPFMAKAPAGIVSEGPRTYSYTITADVTDINGETRSGSQRITVGDLRYTLNLDVPSRLAWEDFKSIGIRTENLNGQFIPAQGKVTLSRITPPERVLRESPLPSGDYELYEKAEFIAHFPHDPYAGEDKLENREVQEPVLAVNFDTGKQTEISVMPGKDWQEGYYVLRGYIRDEKDSIPSEQLVYLYKKEKKKPVDQELFSVTTSKTSYKPGDVAKVTFASSARNAVVVAELEYNGKVVKREELKINNGVKTFSFPVKENYRGNVFVRYYFGKYNTARQGIETIYVPYEENKLEITAGTMRNTLRPGDEETWELTVKGEGKDAFLAGLATEGAEMLATMYDASLDQFKPHSIGWSPYYSRNRSSVLKSWDLQMGYGSKSFLQFYRSYPEISASVPSPVFEQLNWFGFDINGRGRQNRYVSRLHTKYRLFGILEKKAKEAGKKIEGKEGYVAGFVVDTSGDPLPGVNVIVEGTTTGVTTDFDGIFVIKSAEGDRLNFTFIGMESRSVTIGKGMTIVEIIMEEDSSRLEEVVVVGYGGRQKLARTAAAPVSEMAGEVMHDSAALEEVVEEQMASGAEKTEGMASVQPRRALQETAFFFPHLKTDKEGNVTLRFTTPESLTTWKFMAMAHTKALYTANYEASIRTRKELMVVPNPPRFLREGDRIAFQSKITNLSDEILSGRAQLLLFDAFTMQPLDTVFGNSDNERSFQTRAGQSTDVSWTLEVPSGHQAVVYRVVARAGNYSDGEESALPVLTNRMLVTETLPLHIREGQDKTFTMDKLVHTKSATRENYKLTLEMTTNPVWYAVFSLPYLREFPYECSEQVFSRLYGNLISQYLVNSNPKIKAVFDDWNSKGQLKSDLEQNQELKSLLLEETPWVREAADEAEQMKRIAVLFDLNTMRNELGVTFRKLKNKQLDSGGFPWFEGGEANLNITTHIVSGFGHLQAMGISKENYDPDSDDMIEKAIRFIDEKMEEAWDRYKNNNKYPPSLYQGVSWMYARSYFLESYPLRKKGEDIAGYFLGKLEKESFSQSRYHQAVLALVFHRFGKNIPAKKILKAVKDQSVISDEMGMYWKDNRPGWYWYNAPIETQSRLIEAFDEVLQDTESVELMKVWLLKNRQTNRWSSTKATTEAVFVLMNTGKDWINSSGGLEVSLGNEKTDLEHAEGQQQGSGYIKLAWDKEEVKPEMGVVKVSKTSPGVAWGAVYWQYFEDLDQITSAATGIRFKKELYLKKVTEKGPELQKITANTPIHVGDLVTVRLEIRNDRDMEFVHIKDMRASGFEPVNVLSGYRWQGGMGYYESTRDAATNFFADYMPKGVYVFEYDLRANNGGDFSNGITSLQCMYAPEMGANSEGIRVRIE
ncbi:Alpha-2-macroglobulin family N-terminal region [Sinomicrobium oceani]|uniref:Alpha-2-macroglobulin family N-terminal region n=1 Tax=Sinomicrobium oceani TaxID=1150368 RepID=A0A1K1NG79_9FLAO|nr:carboxypeptidase-like regulatory domain-containing protein [Sinomicrobium oceani]SFW34327.1 Alpha-2-macroglobulin family N-terminal region [Sinomicrobium oceani]